MRTPNDNHARTGLLASLALLIAAACGSSFESPPEGIDVPGDLYFSELNDEDATEVCGWWRSHFDYAYEGNGIVCEGGRVLPSGGLEGCVETRGGYGPDSDCHIRVQRFYDCIAATPDYCVEDFAELPEPCRVAATCNGRLEP